MEVMIIAFRGTQEEFEAVRPVIPSTEGDGIVVSGQSAIEDPGEAWTVAKALDAIRYGGRLSNGQYKVMKYVFDQDRQVLAEEIRAEHGWDKNRFRGTMANFPRRVSGALDTDELRLVESHWDYRLNQTIYWLSPEVQEAFKIEYEDTAT